MIWAANRQTCIDVLCAYLRMPYEPDPGEDAPTEKRLAFQASREVRRTVIRVIGNHLNVVVPVSWRGYNFDFTGAVFDGGDFGGAEFSGGRVSFEDAQFSGGEVFFDNALFSGGQVSFLAATFSGVQIFFDGAEFSGGKVSFSPVLFSGGQVSFDAATFSGGQISFRVAQFSGGTVDLSTARAWSHPPVFGPGFDMPRPPPGVTLPASASPPASTGSNW